MGKANGCANGECSLDEVADLIDTLKVQQKELSERVQQVKASRKDAGEPPRPDRCR